MNWWQYLILANVYLGLFYGFYTLLLRRETFFQLNRVYLVSSAIISFLIPAMESEWVRNLFITQRIQQTIYQLDPIVITGPHPATMQHYTIGEVLSLVYLAGIIFLAGRLALQLMLVRRSLRKTGTDDAYSFFGTIKLSEKVASREVIMAHEEVHARQWHSADVMFIEVIMIICWFNPVVYLYRKAIKHIHEFIADRNAIKGGTSRSAYAMLLLSETFKTPAHQIVNPFFNHSLLKQRIMMLQKDNSKRTKLLKYSLSAPLFALMLVLSAATAKQTRVIHAINFKTKAVLSLDADAPALKNAYNAMVVSDEPATTKADLNVPDIEEFKPTADTVKKTSSGVVFTAVEHPAEFPGGLNAFAAFIAKTIKYPTDGSAEKNNGRVIVQFVVERDGKLSDIHVLRGEGEAAKEAVRVLGLSPDWKPGVQNGQAVRQQYTVPISFSKNPVQRTGQVDTAKRKIDISTSTLTATGKTDTQRVIVNISKKPDNVPDPVYFIDGKEANKSELGKVKPSDIKSINVIKGTQATDTYGNKGVNGVIVITTKAEN